MSEPTRGDSARHYLQTVNIADARLAVVEAIRDGVPIDDDELRALVMAEADDTSRKALTMGLAGCRIITDEQAAFAFYLHPNMRDA